MTHSAMETALIREAKRLLDFQWSGEGDLVENARAAQYLVLRDRAGLPPAVEVACRRRLEAFENGPIASLVTVDEKVARAVIENSNVRLLSRQ